MTDLAIVTPEPLAKAVQSASVAEVDAKVLAEAFTPHFAKASERLESSRGIVVTDPTQVSEIKASRVARLALKDIRVAAEKTRKTLKEDSLRKGKAIDGIYNVLLLQLEPEEKRLEDQEKIAERMEAERKAKLQHDRSELLREYADPSMYALSDMKQEAFDDLLNGAKLAKAARIEAERKAAEEAAAREAARHEEEAKVRAENERLRAEALAREAAAKAEREKIEAERREEARKAQAERDAIEAKAKAERAKLEADARREREAAEAKAKAEREATERKHRAALARKTRVAEKAERLLNLCERSLSVIERMHDAGVSDSEVEQLVGELRDEINAIKGVPQ